MSQNVRYKVNIARFLVQCGTIGASKLMRRNFLGRRNLSGIFFYHILNRLYAHTFALGRIEESVLMTGKGSDSLTDLQVSFECFFYLRPKINNHFISTFSGDFDSIILKIYIFNIQASWEVHNLVDSYIVLFSWALLWPLTALARLDGYLSDEPQGTKTTDTLLNWILAPALLVYAAILYLYRLQILFTWSLPKGGVAYLVFGFTMALFTVKALQELVVPRRYDWFFDRISIFALPPLVLFWAGVMQRVGDYGLTDWRVYLIVCGAIMTAAVTLFAARRTGRYYYIAATAFVLFFLTAYIPRFSATAFSLRSQTARAERLAGQTGLLDESGRLDLSRIDERDTAQLKRYRELYASLDYLDDHDTLLLADRFGIARSRELLGCFHSDRIRDYIQWGYELDTAEAAALTSSYSNSELRAPLRIDGYRYCYAPVSFSYNNGSSRYTTSGDTLRLYLPDGRELFRRSFDELFTERCDQLLYWPDDEPLYTADNLLFYRTDSLLISFSWAEVSRGKHRYVALNVDKFYTK